MKILWFTNTPSLAEEKLSNKPVGGGWIKSLEKRIKNKDDIHLGIVFYYNDNIPPFVYNDTSYFPIVIEEKGIIFNFIKRLKGEDSSEKDISRFIKIVDDFKPDIIHVFGTEGPFGLITNHIKDIPIVISIQGNITVYKYKYYSGITRDDVKRFTSLKNRVLLKNANTGYRYFLKKAVREQQILAKTKNVIGRTDWDRRITEILSPGRNYFHNDEILRDSFYQNEWQGKFSAKFELFTINDINLYKGIEVILYTAHLLDQYGLSYRWQIAGINNADEVIALALKSLKITQPKNIVFLGKINEKELVNKLLTSHLYIMPSHIENSPNSLCEAMILGLPCIATDAGGTSSLLTNKVDGLLIQDGDPWSLAGSILEMYFDYDKALLYGKNARKKAKGRHDPEKIVNDLIEIYKATVKND